MYQILHVESLEVLQVRFIVGHGKNEMKSHAISFNVLVFLEKYSKACKSKMG